MRRIYIAGPMSFIPEHNYPAFAQAAVMCRHNGFAVLNPADNFEGKDNLPYDWYIREDLKLMSFATDIAFLEGWRASRGCCLELHIACVLDLDLWEIRDGDYGLYLSKFETPPISLGGIIDDQPEWQQKYLREGVWNFV